MNVLEKLQEPFDPEEIKFKPQVVRGNRCLAIGYVDARVIEDRLDDVFGVDGWQDAYHILPQGNVVCILQCLFDEIWISKSDTGSPSDQPDEGDRMKSAFSDALKRAAVKFGIGRYLYRLPQQWVDYDPATKQIKSPPKLPPWALPKAKEPQAPAKTQPARIDPKLSLPDQMRQIATTGTDALVKAWEGLEMDQKKELVSSGQWEAIKEEAKRHDKPTPPAPQKNGAKEPAWKAKWQKWLDGEPMLDAFQEAWTKNKGKVDLRDFLFDWATKIGLTLDAGTDKWSIPEPEFQPQ